MEHDELTAQGWRGRAAIAIGVGLLLAAASLIGGPVGFAFGAAGGTLLAFGAFTAICPDRTEAAAQRQEGDDSNQENAATRTPALGVVDSPLARSWAGRTTKITKTARQR
jgi:hypothetical protein